MFLVKTSHLSAFENLKAMSFKRILAASIEAQEVFIRIQFENSNTDEGALAAIEVAEKLGLTELAESMKRDYDSATKQAVS